MSKEKKATETEFVINDRLFSVITVVAFNEAIYPGFLSGINRITGLKMVIKHIPISFDILRKQVVEEINDLKAKYQIERNINIQEELRRDYENKAETLQILEQQKARVFDFQMHFIVCADTLEELNEKKKNIFDRLSFLGLKGISLMFDQQEILLSALPIFPKQKIEERIGIPIPAISIAGMYPYTFDSLKDNGPGVILGSDFSNGIILFNQFLGFDENISSRDNANVVIVGMKGIGKTILSKMLLRNHIRNNLSCFIIDPDGEFSHIITEMNGTVFDLDRGDIYSLINPLEIIPDIDEDEINQGLGYTALTRTINQLKAFALFLNPTFDNDTLNVFGQIVLETYNRFNINNNSDFISLKPNMFPTFDDVYATIKGKLISMLEASKEREYIEKVESLIKVLTTTLRPLFTGHTTISMESKFIAFNSRFVTNESVRKALIFNALRYAWGYCLNKNERSVIVIDKTELLIDKNNYYAIDFIAQIQRRNKKYNSGNIINISDISALNKEEHVSNGKTIFENTSYLFTMGCKKNTIEVLSKYERLSDSQKESINYLNVGESFFRCGNRHMNINIILTPSELEDFEIIN